MNFVMAEVTTALNYSTLFSGVVDEAKGAISQVTPLGITIFGILLGIGIGIKVLRKVAK